MTHFQKRASLDHQISHLFHGRIIKSRVFKVEPCFAYTFNKLQGATIKRIVVMLHALQTMKMGTLTCNKLNVAFTRVRKFSHFAIFPALKYDLNHLLDIQHKPWLHAWNIHYNEEGVWIPDAIGQQNKIETLCTTIMKGHSNAKHALENAKKTQLKELGKLLLVPLSTSVMNANGKKVRHDFSVAELRITLLPLFTTFVTLDV
jgi:hypothetical protein